MEQIIQGLLHEARRSRLTERRTEVRQPFARPVQIYQGREDPVDAFSKDLSSQGIGIVSKVNWKAGSVVDLKIYTVSGAPVCLRSEVKWTDSFGTGWYLSGWKFLASVACPMR